MNPQNGPDKSNNERISNARAAIPVAGILVAAALLSGLLSVIGSETAIAQQNMTGTNATAAGNATAMNATAAGNATAMNATAAGNATAMNATAAGNATAMNATGITGS